MKKAKEVRQELDKDESDYRTDDMTEGATAGKMPGVETSNGAAPRQMPAVDMTKGAAAGKMPGVDAYKVGTAGQMPAGDMTEGAAAGKMPGVG